MDGYDNKMPAKLSNDFKIGTGMESNREDLSSSRPLQNEGTTFGEYQKGSKRIYSKNKYQSDEDEEEKENIQETPMTLYKVIKNKEENSKFLDSIMEKRKPKKLRKKILKKKYKGPNVKPLVLPELEYESY